MTKPRASKKASKKKQAVNESTSWRKLLAEQKSSGLSKEAFSQQRGFSVSTFRRWEEKLLAEKNGKDTRPANSTSSSKKVANNTQNMTRAEREAYWQAIIKKFQASGLSQTRFAREHGVSMTALSEWKNYFLRVRAVNPATGGQVESSLVHKADLPGKLELKHPSGFSVIIDANTPQSLLMKTLESLAKLTS